MSRVNPLVLGLAPPPIPEVHGWARRYDGGHGPMLDLCQAVPGYTPHPEMLRHLAEAAGLAESAKYGEICGDPALREAYAASLSSLYRGAVSAAQITITAGCNQAFFLSMLTLAQPGDAVLLPTPWFWNQQMTCEMLGIEARPLPCAPEDGFVPDPDRAETLIDFRVRAIVLVTPNNPTGAVYPPGVIASFHALCRRRGIWLILDETYRDFLPQGQDRAHALFADPDWADSAMQLYSFSKAYCVPGHRLGAVAASPALTAEFSKVLDCLHICPQRAGQKALLWALSALGDWRAANRDEINRRADAMRRAFERVPAWRIESLGAYFAYVRHPWRDRTAVSVAEDMAVRLGALCLPGSAFGAGQEQYLRIAFAAADAGEIAALAQRLSEATLRSLG